MTREKAIVIIGNLPIDGKDKCYSIAEYQEAKTMAIEALEFAQWVADEIIDEDLWELNYGAFAEIACRKLEKLGIVRAKGGIWELAEPQESEEI